MLAALLLWIWWVLGGILWFMEALGKLAALVALVRWCRRTRQRDELAEVARERRGRAVVAKLRGKR